MNNNTKMYKSKYKPVAGLPLTQTLPMLLEWKGLSPERVQEDTDGEIKQANIHRICAGETISPGKNVVTGIADFFGLSFVQIYDVEYVRKHIEGESPQINPIKQSQSVGLNKKDYVSIPKLNVSASMGKGLSSQYLESVVEEIIVERDWLRRSVNATAPGNLALITAYGDSMEGTFSDGDLLLVDRGVESVQIDAVYVLALGDELFIKRLQRRPDGSMLMLSDNSKYAAYEVSNSDLETLRVLGRVLLAWNVRRL